MAMSSDGLWENRLGKQRDNGAFDLCHDVHQLRPDPFNPERCYLFPERNAPILIGPCPVAVEV